MTWTILAVVPDAIGDGWLVAVLAVFVPVVFSASRAVAGRWRASIDELEDELGVLKQEAVVRTETCTKETLRRMFLEAKVEYCEAELESWRAGKWRSPGGPPGGPA